MDTIKKNKAVEKAKQEEPETLVSGETSEKTEEGLFTQEDLDEKYHEGFEAGKAEAEEESFEEISRLKKELEKPTVNQKGLYEVTVEGEVYILKTRGKITLPEGEITAKELIDNTRLCEELIQKGTSLFKKKSV